MSMGESAMINSSLPYRLNLTLNLTLTLALLLPYFAAVFENFCKIERIGYSGGIQPAENRPVFFIDGDECGKKPVIRFPVVRLRLIGVPKADKIGDIGKIDIAQPDCRDKRCPPRIG